MQHTFHKLVPLFSLMTLALAACGGGGDDNSTSSASSPQPAASADKFVGTWILNCAPSPLTRAGTPLQRKVTYTFTKVNATQVSYTTSADIYDSATCTGAPLVHLSADPGTVQIDGTTLSAGAPTDMVTVSRGAWLSPFGGNIVAGGTITINGITYPGNFFVKPAPTKDLAQVTNSTLTFGNTASPPDAQGYPTGLSGNTYQKQ